MLLSIPSLLLLEQADHSYPEYSNPRHVMQDSMEARLITMGCPSLMM